MNAGLPGTGLGGLFYILSALWMPVHRLLNGRRHSGRRWPRILAQMSIAGGILLALFATGWVLGLVITAAIVDGSGVGGGAVVQQARNLVRWVAVIGTAGLLAGLLLTVELASLVVRWRGRRAVAKRTTNVIALGRRLPDVA